MKILSKYKDYYDYLVGKYGIDPLIVLDRRDYTNYVCEYPQQLILYIAGMEIHGFFDGKNYYYGQNLKTIASKVLKQWYNSKQVAEIYYEHNDHTYIVNIPINIYHSDINDTMDCPILLKTELKEFIKYPILSKLNVQSILSPEIIYNALSKWLSTKRSNLENKPDNRTNKEKILTNGFDLKTSFRNIKK